MVERKVSTILRMGKYIPTIEDVAELSEINSLPPGGLPLTHRMGEVTGMRKGKHVLVVSSAQGDQALYYVENFGVMVTGVDISEYMHSVSIQQAFDRGLEKLAHFDLGDAQSLSYPANEFDIVINEGAIAIPDRPADVLSEMVRVAKPGAPICFRESVWLKSLDVDEKVELSERYGTCPLEIEEWNVLFKSCGVQDILCELEPWSNPEHFWQVRRDRVVLSHEDIYSISEKLKIGKKIYDLYGMEGLTQVKKNEKIFYQAIIDGKIGYGMYKGIKA